MGIRISGGDDHTPEQHAAIFQAALQATRSQRANLHARDLEDAAQSAADYHQENNDRRENNRKRAVMAGYFVAAALAVTVIGTAARAGYLYVADWKKSVKIGIVDMELRARQNDCALSDLDGQSIQVDQQEIFGGRGSQTVHIRVIPSAPDRNAQLKGEFRGLSTSVSGS